MTTTEREPLLEQDAANAGVKKATHGPASITLAPDPALAVTGIDLDWEVGIDWVALGLEEPQPVVEEEVELVSASGAQACSNQTVSS